MTGCLRAMLMLLLVATAGVAGLRGSAGLAQGNCAGQPTRTCLYGAALDGAAAFTDRKLRTWYLTGWIETLAAAPRPDDPEAIAYVERAIGLMEGGEQRDNAVAALATLQARAGHLDAALATLDRHGASASVARARIALAIALDRAGRGGEVPAQIEQARAAVQQIFDPANPDDLVSLLAPMMLEARGLPVAGAIFDLGLVPLLTAGDAKDRLYALTAFGRSAGEAGLEPAARRVFAMARTQIDSLPLARERGGARLFLVDAQVKLGLTDPALEDAVRIDPSYSLVLALITIGEAQAGRGDLAGARKTFADAMRAAETRVEIFDRLNAFLPLARACRAAGLEDETRVALGRARTSLERETDPARRLNILAALANAHREAGEYRSAGDLLTGVLAEVRAPGFTGDRNAALWQIAFHFGRIGSYAEAIATIDSLPAEDMRLRARLMLVVAYADADLITDAASWMERDRPGLAYGDVAANAAAYLDAVSAMARAYARAGRTADVARTLAPAVAVSDLAETGKRASWQREAVEIYGSVGLLDAAWAVGRRIADLQLRYDAVTALADALVRAGRLPEIGQLADRMRASAELPADLRLSFALALSTMVP